MDTISVKGETYIKGAKIAQELGYTADYVGQLCRSGQVVGMLVGRSWYVSEQSIRAHRKGRYRSNQVKSLDAVREIIEVRKQPRTQEDNFSVASASYEIDDQPLIPSISKRVDDFTNKPTPIHQDKKPEESEESTSVPLRKPILTPNVAESQAVKLETTPKHDVRYIVSEGQPVQTASRVNLRPETVQKTYKEAEPSPYISLVASAVIASGFLLFVVLIGLEQHTFASRVMPLDTEYFFDLTSGMQAAAALWSAD